MLRVGVIHGNPLTLWALQQILTLGGEATVRTALPAVPADPPAGLDVLLLDIDAAPAPVRGTFIARLAPHTRVLMVCPPERVREVRDCLAFGAEGHLTDACTPQTVRAAVYGTSAEQCPPALSGRERQVLDCIAGGLTQSQTARRLGISTHTVDTYTRRVRRKLGLGNKADLTRAALAGAHVPVP
jgi:DNA-binding CsgD family transcriptional regulator